jgi:protein-disulfide isomerase
MAEQDRQIAEMAKRTEQIEVALLAKKVADIDEKIEQLQRDLTAPHAGNAPPPVPAARRTLDPAVTYAVPLGASPALGSPKAKVTIVMAFEFACPYCRRAWGTMDDLRTKYGNDLRVVYKQLVVHPQVATYAAHAACAANKQGKWREMADLIWTKGFDARDWEPDNIDAMADEIKLDKARYQSDMNGICSQEIGDDAALFKKLSITATPTFFVNGRFVQGAQPQATFEAVIDEEMAKANAAIKKGVKADRYYDQEVLGKGVAEAPKP